jgi:hypothetical protein
MIKKCTLPKAIFPKHPSPRYFLAIVRVRYTFVPIFFTASQKGLFMKRVFTSIGVIIMALATTGCGPQKTESGFYKGYETPAYTVEKTLQDNVEVRLYTAHVTAEVTVSGDRDEAIGNGFRILAGYIFGGNSGQSKISMTSPVVQESKPEKIAMTSPVTQSPANNSEWTVTFSMPRNYQIKDLPQPDNKNITFVEKPAQRIAALVFSGLARDGRIKKHKDILVKSIDAAGLKMLSEPGIAYYDDPFTLPWNRRNEVFAVLKGGDKK